MIMKRMSALPEERLKPSPPLFYICVDYFGPFVINGEVQKRITLLPRLQVHALINETAHFWSDQVVSNTLSGETLSGESDEFFGK